METGFTPTPLGGLNADGIPHQTVLEYRQKKEMIGHVGTKPTQARKTKAVETVQAEGQSDGQQVAQADTEDKDEEMVVEDESLFVLQAPRSPTATPSQSRPAVLGKEVGEITDAHEHNSAVPASGSTLSPGPGLGRMAPPQTPHKIIGQSYATPPATMQTPEDFDFGRPGPYTPLPWLTRSPENFDFYNPGPYTPQTERIRDPSSYMNTHTGSYMPSFSAYGQLAYARKETIIRQAMTTPSKTRASHVHQPDGRKGAQNGYKGYGRQEASYLGEDEKATERARRDLESRDKVWKYGQQASVPRNPSRSQSLQQSHINGRIIRGQEVGVGGLRGETSETPQRKMNMFEEDYGDDDDDKIPTSRYPSAGIDIFGDGVKDSARGNMHGGQTPYRNAEFMAPPRTAGRTADGNGYSSRRHRFFSLSLSNNDAGSPSVEPRLSFPHDNVQNFDNQQYAKPGQKNSAGHLDFKATKQPSNTSLPGYRVPKRTPAEANKPNEGSRSFASKTISSLFQEDDF